MAEQQRTIGAVTYREAEAGYFEQRRLRRFAGVWSLWALGVAAVISGNCSVAMPEIIPELPIITIAEYVFVATNSRVNATNPAAICFQTGQCFILPETLLNLNR